MKDYYTILECSPSSTRDEIKRNFRRLAQQYHPDKNAGDAYATARFHDIREAYETLTQPAKKNAWLQERWLQQVMNTAIGETEPLTPYLILDKVLKTEKYIATSDSFRMDYLRMATVLEELISTENRNCLLTFNELEVNRTIVRRLISTAKPFPLHFLGKFIHYLEQFTAGDLESYQCVQQFKKQLRLKHNWEIIKIPLILLFTLIICLIIYSVGKQSH